MSTGDVVLDELLEEWNLPDEAADVVRRSFAYQARRLSHEYRALLRALVFDAESKAFHRKQRRVPRCPQLADALQCTLPATHLVIHHFDVDDAGFTDDRRFHARVWVPR